MWDLLASYDEGEGDYNAGEWGHALDCGLSGYDGKFTVPGGSDSCRITRYECGGILVNANGALISETCFNWP